MLYINANTAYNGTFFYRIIEEEMGNYRIAITIFEKALMVYKDLGCSNDHYFSNTIEWIVCLREKVFLAKSEISKMKINIIPRTSSFQSVDF